MDYLSIILSLFLHATTLSAIPVGNVPAAVSDPAHIIPGDFTISLRSRQGRTIEPFGLYASGLFAATSLAHQDYDAIIDGCAYSCSWPAAVDVFSAEFPGRILNRIGLWGLYSCGKRLREVAGQGAETVDPQICELQLPAKIEVGKIGYRDIQDRPLVETRASADPKINNLSSGAALVGQETDTFTLDAANVDANSTLSPIPNAQVDSVCTIDKQKRSTELVTNSWVGARVTATTDVSIDKSNVIFTMLEAVLELAASIPRLTVLPPDWYFDYTSIAEGLTIDLKVNERAPGSPDPKYAYAIEGFIRAVLAYQGGPPPWKEWREADFDILVGDGGYPVLSLKIRKTA